MTPASLSPGLDAHTTCAFGFYRSSLPAAAWIPHWWREISSLRGQSCLACLSVGPYTRTQTPGLDSSRCTPQTSKTNSRRRVPTPHTSSPRTSTHQSSTLTPQGCRLPSPPWEEPWPTWARIHLSGSRTTSRSRRPAPSPPRPREAGQWYPSLAISQHPPLGVTTATIPKHLSLAPPGSPGPCRWCVVCDCLCL